MDKIREVRCDLSQYIQILTCDVQKLAALRTEADAAVVRAEEAEAKNKKYATEIIHECHEAWRRLITGESPAKTPAYDLSIRNTTIPNSPGYTKTDEGVPPDSRKPPAPVDPSSKSYFLEPISVPA